MAAHSAPFLIRRPGRPVALPGAHGQPAAWLLAALSCVLALGACATKPPHYPSQTAQTFVGKPLFNLEMRWSTPSSSSQFHGGRVARWDFDQYNYAGCSVTVRTDSADIIRTISWSPGCGPKAKRKAH